MNIADNKKSDLKYFCLLTIKQLESAENFGAVYVDACMKLYRYKNQLKFGLFSSGHYNIFEDILNCLGAAKWEGKGEYANNFREFIKYHIK